MKVGILRPNISMRTLGQILEEERGREGERKWRLSQVQILSHIKPIIMSIQGHI
jgi:hypothetical protein